MIFINLLNIRSQLEKGKSISELSLRVVIYARVSTDHLEQKNSLANQIEYFKKYIRNNINWQYIYSYVDVGITGTSDLKRVNFMKMIADSKKDKFDLIVTKEISRFSRNTLDSIKYTRELLQNGVAVYFVNDNINTLSPDSELRLTIMASLAQDEVRRLSERIRFGMNRAIEKKQVLGNNSLYGYYKDRVNNKFVVNEKEGIIVKKVYELYVIDKLSISKIVKILKNDGVKSSLGNDFSVSSISRMIENPKYKGYYCGRKTKIKDYMTKKVEYLDKSKWVVCENKEKIPPIVTEELWNLANSRLSKRKENYKRNTSNKVEHLYSGKIFCGNDQTVFYRRYFKRNKSDATWVCLTHLKSSDKCSVSNLRESELNEIFADVVEILKITPDNLIQIMLDKYKELYKRNLIKNKNIVKIKRLKKEISKLLNLYTYDVISKDELMKMINDKKSKLIASTKASKQKFDINNIKSFLEKNITEDIIRTFLIKEILEKILVQNINNRIVLDIYLNCIDLNNSYCVEKKFLRDEKIQVHYVVIYHFN